MKPVLVSAISFAFLLAGCQPATPASPALTNPPASPAVKVPTFEVRDFTLDEKKETYGSTYTGRGTLIAKSPELSKGGYFVWVAVKQGHNNDEDWKTLILLKDGVGTIKSYDFLGKDDREKKHVKYFDWQILGYAPLLEGVMIQGPQTAAK